MSLLYFLAFILSITTLTAMIQLAIVRMVAGEPAPDESPVEDESSLHSPARNRERHSVS
jgi:hypothetical protein